MAREGIAGKTPTPTITCNVVRVHFASEMDVAVGIESFDELVALIAEVRLGGEDLWCGGGGEWFD